jgi:hypothetical protein
MKRLWFNWRRMPMRLPRRRRNQLANLPLFLAKWEDEAHAANLQFVRVCTSEAGNINTSGKNGDYTSSILSRYQPQFELSLEEGVRDLVKLFIERYNWITYTSCAGHRYADERIPPTPRHVGLLPRSREEAHRMTATLTSVAAQLRHSRRHDAVRVKVVRTDVTADDGHVYPTIEFLFARTFLTTWDRYFSSLDAIYHEALAALEAAAAEGRP